MLFDKIQISFSESAFLYIKFTSEIQICFKIFQENSSIAKKLLKNAILASYPKVLPGPLLPPTSLTPGMTNTKSDKHKNVFPVQTYNIFKFSALLSFFHHHHRLFPLHYIFIICSTYVLSVCDDFQHTHTHKNKNKIFGVTIISAVDSCKLNSRSHYTKKKK